MSTFNKPTPSSNPQSDAKDPKSSGLGKPDQQSSGKHDIGMKPGETPKPGGKPDNKDVQRTGSGTQPMNKPMPDTAKK
jgi:hypothetical protein